MVATAIRTDIHRPSAPEFDPEAYRLVDVYDLHPQSGDHRFLNEELRKLEAQGLTLSGNVRAACGHCGQTNIRYAALLVRDDVREFIFVGQDCLAGRFAGQTKASFAKLRKDAELDRAKQRVKAAWLALCDAHPGLAYASYAGDIIDAYVSAASDPRDAAHLAAGAGWALSTLDDIARKARRNGYASDKQVAFVERLWVEVDQKLAAHATRQAAAATEPPAAPAPEGRVQIVGEVVSAKWYENGFGGAVKLTIKGDAGWRVWVTQPSTLDADKGDRVRLTATVTRSDDDPSFAFGKRPAGAEILARAAD